MRLTEGETKALLASALLVVLAAFGRLLLMPEVADVRGDGLTVAGGIDSALAVAESTRKASERRTEPLGQGELIDMNTATEVELDRLPGVGPALARAIMRSREQDGPFRSIDDLQRVPGLGEKKVSQLAPFTSLARSAGGGGNARRDGGGSGASTPGRAGRDLVNLNRASAAELEALPGIGPARARAIVRWRAVHGGFRELDDILRVPGIGPATLERLRALAVVQP